MNEAPRSWRLKLWRLLKTFGWLILLVLIAQQVWWAPFRADAARARVIERFQQERKSRVIAMIHRQDTQSLFGVPVSQRSEEHTSELQSRLHLVCRLLLEKKKNGPRNYPTSF